MKNPDANEILRTQGSGALREVIDKSEPLKLKAGTRQHVANGATEFEDTFGNDGEQSSKEPPKVFWHGEVDYRESRPQLVQDVIPEVGHGLISGQWGTFKTFGALELAHACMSGEPFLGYEVMRHGGVLFIALEGAGEVPIRLQGVIEERGKIEGTAPFAWSETCPPLIGKNAADEICAIAEPIAGELKARFGVPLVLIIIDTIIAGAGYTKD